MTTIEKVRKEITVRIPDRKVPVEADCYGDYAVHRPIMASWVDGKRGSSFVSENPKDGFVVTHIPCGMVVIRGASDDIKKIRRGRTTGIRFMTAIAKELATLPPLAMTKKNVPTAESTQLLKEVVQRHVYGEE